MYTQLISLKTACICRHCFNVAILRHITPKIFIIHHINCTCLYRCKHQSVGELHAGQDWFTQLWYLLVSKTQHILVCFVLFPASSKTDFSCSLYSWLQRELQHNWEYWRNCLQCRVLHLGREWGCQGKSSSTKTVCCKFTINTSSSVCFGFMDILLALMVIVDDEVAGVVV